MSRRDVTARIGYFRHRKPAADYAEALASNNPYYYGAPCTAGHKGVRHTENRKCVACQNFSLREAESIKTDKPPGRNPKLIRDLEYEREIKAANAEVWDE